MSAMKLRFGGYQNSSSIHSRSAEIFGKLLGSHLKDGCDFQLDRDITQLGHSTDDLIPLTECGDLNFCYMSTSYFSNHVPEARALDLPFIFSDRSAAYAALDGTFGVSLKKAIEQRHPGLRLLNFWDNGFRHFSNRVRPIRTPADCIGLKTRTLPSKLHGQAFELLGFKPVAVNIKTFLEQIESTDIDAQDNPLTNYYNFGLHKYHRYVTMTAHIFGAAGLWCCAKDYDSWSENTRQSVIEAATEATKIQRQFAEVADAEILNKLDPEEVEVIQLSDDQRAAFATAVRPILDQ